MFRLTVGAVEGVTTLQPSLLRLQDSTACSAAGAWPWKPSFVWRSSETMGGAGSMWSIIRSFLWFLRGLRGISGILESEHTTHFPSRFSRPYLLPVVA
ncbi:hypothetical protein NN561_019285 [Cricetulus griseus]